MQVAVRGTTLFFDIVGARLGPEGGRMRERPTVILLHGGPGGYDHSYFRPSFDWLAEHAQVVYLDLREHGRSERGDVTRWSFEACADDVAAFCDALSIEAPIVVGHSMGGFVALLLGARFPRLPGGLVLLGTMARFDLDRLVEGVRTAAGDEVAEIAHRSYGGEDVSDAEWERVRIAFGPNVLSESERSRLIRNPGLRDVGMECLRGYDISDQLGRIEQPTLVCVGRLDPVTPVAVAEEIMGGLRPGVGRLEVVEGAGHWLWLDAPGHVRELLDGFVESLASEPVPSS